MQLASYIDHTYLKPDCSFGILDRLMEEARLHGFKAICIPPSFLPYAKEKAGMRSFLLCTVAGFPIGYDHLEAKLTSLQTSAHLGAEEVDVVINLSAVKTGNWDYIQEEMITLRDAAAEHKVTLKYIIEAQLLTEEEIRKICLLSNEVRLPFVKTSTGFFGEPVRVETVRLMRENLLPAVQLKVSGGITSYAQAIAMVEAGANRLGCSQSVRIVTEKE